MTNNDAVTLMKAELNFLMWDCSNTLVFYAPTSGGHTEYKMTFAEYKASTLDAGTLAKVFYDNYIRSGASEELVNKRAQLANNWYNMLKDM